MAHPCHANISAWLPKTARLLSFSQVPVRSIQLARAWKVPGTRVRKYDTTHRHTAWLALHSTTKQNQDSKILTGKQEKDCILESSLVQIVFFRFFYPFRSCRKTNGRNVYLFTGLARIELINIVPRWADCYGLGNKTGANRSTPHQRPPAVAIVIVIIRGWPASTEQSVCACITINLTVQGPVGTVIPDGTPLAQAGGCHVWPPAQRSGSGLS
ncbi:hypothetical protein BDZ91DRAFT_422396 [Kalaharituber pfeilii]|nr:hypothetical protein BDZ91DRAFT_422396 [Kalaharituber pfeilii]